MILYAYLPDILVVEGYSQDVCEATHYSDRGTTDKWARLSGTIKITSVVGSTY